MKPVLRMAGNVLARLGGFARLFLPAGVIIVILGGFLMPTTSGWAYLVYIILAPLMLFTLLAGWQPTWRETPMAMLLALLAWSVACVFWGHNYAPYGYSGAVWFFNGVLTAVFVCGVLAAAQVWPQLVSCVITALIAGGTGNALICLLLDQRFDHTSNRLSGYGLTFNPVVGATLVAGCMILATGRLLGHARQRWMYAACVVVMAGYMYLSASRTAIFATAICLVILFGGAVAGQLWRALAGLAAISAVAAMLFRHAIYARLWGFFGKRGSDCHLFIWRTAWGQIMQHPLLGNGPQDNLPIPPGIAQCPQYTHPHELYLSLLYYSGAIGLCLFAATVFTLWRRLLRMEHALSKHMLLAYGALPLIAGLTDLSQIIKGPGADWYIIWLPMLLAACVPLKGGRL